MHVVLLALGLWLLTGAGQAAPDVAPSTSEWLRTPPLGVVGRQGPWTFYSRGVNQVTCADTQGGETWVGTAMGVKRLNGAGTLRGLYTRADGLPGDAILALAVEPRDVWAVVFTGFPNERFALCHLDREKDRWETLREVPNQQMPGTEGGSAHNFVAAGPSVVAFTLGNVARSHAGTALFLWNKAKRTWTDVPWGPNGTDPLEPNFALALRDRAGGDAVLIGTSMGLRRYDVGAGSWRTFLPERAAVGAARTPDGALWLETVLRPALASEGRLSLVRLDPDTGTIQDERVATEGMSAYVYIAQTLVPADDGALWLVDHPTGGVFGANSLLTPVVGRVDTRTGVGRTVDLRAAKGGDVPAAVWGEAVQSRMDLPMDNVARHLPGWLGPAADLPSAVTAGEEPFYRSRLEDSEAVWTVPAEFGDAPGLTRAGRDGVVQKFPLPKTPLQMTPPAGAVVIVGRTLLALTSDGLYRRALPGGPWRIVSLPVRVSAYGDRLVPAGDSVWIVANGGAFRYRPATGLLTPAQDAPAAPTGAASAPLPKGAPAPDPGFLVGWDDGRVGEAGGRVWYTQTFLPVQASVTPSDAPATVGRPVRHGYTLVTGYIPATGAWTEPLRFDRPVSGLSLQETPESVYLTVGQRRSYMDGSMVGDVYRYDRIGAYWARVAPPIPADITGALSAARLVWVDAESVWLLDPRSVALWRWNRARQTWRGYPSGTHASGSPLNEENMVARDGNDFYVASDAGLWRFDIAGSRWTRPTLPVPASHVRLLLRDADARAVWALGWSDGFYAARFDKKAHTWRLWDETRGFPAHRDPIELASDGVTALANASDGVYRLNAKTGRWDDLNPAWRRALSGAPPETAASVPFVQFLAGDGGDVWLRVGRRGPSGPDFGAPPTLLRWDPRRGAFDACTAPTRTPPAPSGLPGGWGMDLLPDRADVWLLAPGGVWRFVKATREWQFLAPPAGFPPLAFDRLQRTSDGSVWLIGRDVLLRWSGP